MALRPKNVCLAVIALLVVIPVISCVKIRGPGIMPVIEDSGQGEWVVVSKTTDPARTDSDVQILRWGIILQYVPGEDGRRITARDISVSFDGDPVPFIFQEEDQILETAVHAVFGPSQTHCFILDPAKDSNLSFPSFELVIR